MRNKAKVSLETTAVNLYFSTLSLTGQAEPSLRSLLSVFVLFHYVFVLNDRDWCSFFEEAVIMRRKTLLLSFAYLRSALAEKSPTLNLCLCFFIFIEKGKL